MDSTKIVIVVLILISLVFVIFVTRGSLTEDQPKNVNQNDARKEAANTNRPSLPGAEAFKRLLGGLQEAVILCDPNLSSTSNRKCENLSGTIEIHKAKKSSIPFVGPTRFRTVELEVIKGMAVISYKDEKGINKVDNPQVLELPDPDSKTPRLGRIVISEAGGKLTIACKQNTLCQVGQP